MPPYGPPHSSKLEPHTAGAQLFMTLYSRGAPAFSSQGPCIEHFSAHEPEQVELFHQLHVQLFVTITTPASHRLGDRQLAAAAAHPAALSARHPAAPQLPVTATGSGIGGRGAGAPCTRAASRVKAEGRLWGPAAATPFCLGSAAWRSANPAASFLLFGF